ncbi:MAG: RNA-binding domain-containing protein [Thermoplasmata archaeon]
MKRAFAGLRARTYCHATESLERVRTAMVNALGEVKIKVSQTEGVHGNSIAVLEAMIDDFKSIVGFLSRLNGEDLEELVRTLDSRIDDSCNLFMRIGKQEAYQGSVRLARGDDVISVRIRIMAFPARSSVASDIVREFLSESLARKVR